MELSQIQKVLEDFKTANDQKLDEIRKLGVADPASTEKMEKTLSAFQGMQVEFNELKSGHTALESAMRRVSRGGDADESGVTAKHLREMKAMCKDGGVNIDEKSYNERRGLLNRYMRRGDETISNFDVRAMTVDSDPSGGYSVMPDQSGRIVQFIYNTSPVRQVASIQTVTSDSLEGELDLDQASGGWVEERTPESDTSTATIGRWKIPVHEQRAQPKITQKLLDDSSMDVESWHAMKVASRFSRDENLAFVLGDGVAKPRGFLTYPSGVPSGATPSQIWQVIEQVKSGTNGSFDFSATPQTPGNALLTLIFKLKKEYRNNAVFAMNRHTLGEVMKLTDEFGRYLWIPDFTQNGIGIKLLGYNVVEMEDMPDITTTGALGIAFGDFREAYQIVDRAGIRILRDPYTSKPYVKFYTTKRVGGDVINFDALKIMSFAA